MFSTNAKPEVQTITTIGGWHWQFTTTFSTQNQLLYRLQFAGRGSTLDKDLEDEMGSVDAPLFFKGIREILHGIP